MSNTTNETEVIVVKIPPFVTNPDDMIPSGGPKKYVGQIDRDYTYVPYDRKPEKPRGFYTWIDYNKND